MLEALLYGLREPFESIGAFIEAGGWVLPWIVIAALVSVEGAGLEKDCFLYVSRKTFNRLRDEKRFADLIAAVPYARMIGVVCSEDAAGELLSFNQHVKNGGYMVPAGDVPADTLMSIINEIMANFK